MLSGSVGPAALHDIIILLLFIWYVGVQVGNRVGKVVQPLWLHPGGRSPGGGNTDPLGAAGQYDGPLTHCGGGGGGGPRAVSLKK